MLLLLACLRVTVTPHPVTCGDGTVLRAGRCEVSEDVCGEGWVLLAGECALVGPLPEVLRCGEGTKPVAGRCERIPEPRPTTLNDPLLEVSCLAACQQELGPSAGCGLRCMSPYEVIGGMGTP